MEKNRMRFPAQSCHETPRARDQRLAVTARAQREHEHHLAFGNPQPRIDYCVEYAEGYGPMVVGGRPEVSS